MYLPFSQSSGHWLATAHSGVSFTALEPHSFWSDTLGFDLETLCVTVKTVLGDAGNIKDSLLPRVVIKPGVSCVTAYAGLSQAVVPGGTFAKAGFPAGAIQTNVTDEIVATSSAVLSNRGSHFLVEVSGITPTDYQGAGVGNNSIRAIVGRFESFGSFSQADSSSGITVEHVGEPYMVSSLRVRILQPDGTMATEVGNDNCIFLELDRRETDSADDKKMKKK
jgi:hypothetical protein